MELTKALRQEWEYMVVERQTGHSEKNMNEFGKESWELVSFQMNGHDVVEIYKRPR